MHDLKPPSLWIAILAASLGLLVGACAPLAGGPLLPAFDTWLGLAVALLIVPGLGMLAQDSAEPGAGAEP